VAAGMVLEPPQPDSSRATNAAEIEIFFMDMISLRTDVLGSIYHNFQTKSMSAFEIQTEFDGIHEEFDKNVNDWQHVQSRMPHV
jgi:hypothetical protein